MLHRTAPACAHIGVYARKSECSRSQFRSLTEKHGCVHDRIRDLGCQTRVNTGGKEDVLSPASLIGRAAPRYIISSPGGSSRVSTTLTWGVVVRANRAYQPMEQTT